MQALIALRFKKHALSWLGAGLVDDLAYTEPQLSSKTGQNAFLFKRLQDTGVQLLPARAIPARQTRSVDCAAIVPIAFTIPCIPVAAIHVHVTRLGDMHMLSS